MTMGRVPPLGRHWMWVAAFATQALGLAACSSGGDTVTPPPPPSELAPLVGFWRASQVLHTLQGDSSVQVDIVAAGGTFEITIESNGDYNVRLVYLGATVRESGKARVSGSKLYLRRTDPSPAAEGSVDFQLQGSSMVWDGQSRLDFNGDGNQSDTFLHVELARS